MSPIPVLDGLRRAPARHFARLALPVLGVPVRFESNSSEVLRVAEEAFGAWRTLRRRPEWIDAARVRVRIRVRPGGSSADGITPVHHGVPRRELLLLNSGGCHGYADTQQREAVAEVSEALLAHPQHFRAGVLEAMALFITARLNRDPLHAAAVVRGGRALLLAGRSGVGKSTLVYAAMRAGLRVLSEDAVYLQLAPLRVWGMPRYIHLQPEAARFFPELGEIEPRLLANGKLKRPVRVAAAQGAEWPAVEHAAVCLLARGDGARLEAIDPAEAVRALSAAPEGGFDLYADSVGTRIAAIAARGAWRLTLPSHPGETVPVLHQMFDAMEGAAPAAASSLA